MSKSIYDQALEYLSILVEQANARKLSNDIVVNRWGLERIRKVISNAQKQERLLELYKELNICYKKLIEHESLIYSLNTWQYSQIIDLEHKIKELVK